MPVWRSGVLFAGCQSQGMQGHGEVGDCAGVAQRAPGQFLDSVQPVADGVAVAVQEPCRVGRRACCREPALQGFQQTVPFAGRELKYAFEDGTGDPSRFVGSGCYQQGGRAVVEACDACGPTACAGEC
ncbi:hypothetical protein GCM10010211_74410 [Streptomyces albospinus]|uniref:Lipoprotein n=1 Tax=Streptomyces albospinus TaxID=285515 RepID=A0ABQ2VLC0_9ACTN|nr:hypothetical protein GCM10010211_74410 [Streptomyces albospinus]